MCGIVGIAFTKDQAYLSAIPKMRDELFHRGPDHEGLWVAPEEGIGLGHRRLSIIDLSSHGHQPMISATGRFVIVYNGEIYNYKLLQKELEKEHQIALKGHSDTEVFLAAVEAWGLEKTLAACVGMFAIALWDRLEKILYLIRDRFGEKPLYYGWIDHSLVFASELKAFRHFPGFRDVKINKNILPSYLRYGCIPAPHSIYEGIYKVNPGRYLKISGPNKVEEKIYWSAKEEAQKARLSQFNYSFHDAADMLEARLKEAVGLQMVADVPVGAFLSGGIDSSLIVALMQAQSSSQVKTFSIGFHEKKFNEANYAKEVARHLGTDHTELYMTPEDCQQAIPLLPQLYDEPFADSSQLPTYLVAKLAREKVTVSLSGDGGDELFGGYQRYFYADYLWNLCKYFPYFFREILGKGCYLAQKSLPVSFHQKNIANKFSKCADLLKNAREKYDFYFSFLGIDPKPWLIESENEFTTTNTLRAGWLETSNFKEWMMHLDTVAYLPDDILTKVDRAGMAVSLESRIPFLDHRVYEFAWQLPINYKLERGIGKKILRKILYKYVPTNLIERPKQGFGIPLGEWMRGPLRSTFEEIVLDENVLRDYWDVDNLQKYWQFVCQSSNNKFNAVFWYIFVFHKWLDNMQSA